MHAVFDSSRFGALPRAYDWIQTKRSDQAPLDELTEWLNGWMAGWLIPLTAFWIGWSVWRNLEPTRNPPRRHHWCAESTGRGSDLIAPMAVPIFGGMRIELLTMFVVHVLYSLKEEIFTGSPDHAPA